MDQIIIRLRQSFLCHQKLFIELLPGLSPVYLISISTPRSQSGKLIIFLAKIENLDRISHIQNEDLSAFRIGACLKHQGLPPESS